MREGTGNFQNGDLLYMATHPVADAIRIGRTKPYECSYPVMVERPRSKDCYCDFLVKWEIKFSLILQDLEKI